MEQQIIDISRLHSNDGQVAGLPANPRSITDEKFELLKKSISDNPEMLSLREVVAYDNNGELVVIMGNMRLRALRELGHKNIPTKILPQDTTIDKLKAYSVIDNSGFGKWDWDMLANEWDEKQLTDWGVNLPIFGDETKVNPDDYGDSFSLPDGDKKNVETITFTLSSEQAEFIKEQIKVSQYDDADTFGNTNKNGNALYAIVKQWADVRK